MAEKATDPAAGIDSIQRTNRKASNAILVLGALYVVHWITVVLVVAPEENLTWGNAVAAFSIATTLLCLLAWSAACVRRGGRLWGAVVLSTYCLAGAGVSAALAASSILSEHPGFVLLEIVIVVWALVTLSLLTGAHKARIDPPHD
ncbi:MAG: hypothetical protein ACYTFA_17560 [Planctomycetota bacterium]